ncbi:conserved hypothetical protein [Shewanella sediminis HAW-EB3]|uniref:Tetrahaem cytochrome domain-containing protein n=1 Tax=Shewanella sediminis (strain HAW-EB3) TaxID=425104 RepID=A8FQK5_SHESH|nr:cytochrome c3 family protein [Shewanella sediminis]ABV35128.1 conserved hypothetical protein [Shewanella sediminis HAW-EB3]
MLRILGLTFLLILSGYVLAEPIAETHAEMSGCESCHINGEPSDDMVHENSSCVECHGPLSDFADETHQRHHDVLECSNCHLAHDEVKLNDSCVNCH